MRYFVLSAMLAAFGASASFGAACSVGPVNLTTMPSNCSFGGWTLGGFGLDASSSAWGYLGEPKANNFQVQIASAPARSGFGPGLAVTFSAAPGGTNFLIANSGDPNQTSSFKTLFNIESGPIFVESLVYADVATVSSTTNGSIVVQAGTGDPSVSGNPTFANGTVLTTNGYQSSNPLALSGFAGNTRGLISVFDNIQISSGNNGTAAISAFTNLFYLPTSSTGTSVPEPMTFVLIGGGLLAITALRRRS